MKKLVTRRAALAVVAVVMVLSLAAGRAQPAAAAPGDLVADVLVPEADPVWARGLAPSVAFDGRYLYYLDYAGSILHRIDVPPAGSAMTGTGHVDAPVVGAPSGIMTIAYDQRFAMGVATMHAVLVTIALGQGLGFFIILFAGLMTVPPWTSNAENVRPVFRKMRELKERCEKILGAPLPQLSMGMSGDFEVAIEEGATLVRLGTVLLEGLSL